MAHITTVNLSNDKWNETDAGLIAVGVFEDKSFTPMAQEINTASDGAFSQAVEIGDVKGKNGESHTFYLEGKRVLLLGLGKKEKYNAMSVRVAAGKASRSAIGKKVETVAIECLCIDCNHCQAVG